MFANMRNVENGWLEFREGVVDESILNTYAFISDILSAG